jgi:hypothetical protein
VERGSKRNKYLEIMDNSENPLQAVSTVNRGGRRSMFSAKQKRLMGAKKCTAGHRVCEIYVLLKNDLNSRLYSTVKKMASNSDPRACSGKRGG